MKDVTWGQQQEMRDAVLNREPVFSEPSDGEAHNRAADEIIRKIRWVLSDPVPSRRDRSILLD